jgi:hypothetical protein
MSDTAIYKLYPQVVSINAGVDAYDKDGKLVPIDMELVAAEDAKLAAQRKLDNCKSEAKTRIAATDWSVLPDVGLANVAAFEAYRATLRGLIKNPVADPVWPIEPEPVWS